MNLLSIIDAGINSNYTTIDSISNTLGSIHNMPHLYDALPDITQKISQNLGYYSQQASDPGASYALLIVGGIVLISLAFGIGYSLLGMKIEGRTLHTKTAPSKPKAQYVADPNPERADWAKHQNIRNQTYHHK